MRQGERLRRSDSAARRGRPPRRLPGTRGSVRRAARRAGAGAEVPPADDLGIHPAPRHAHGRSARARDGAPHARPHGGRRDVRPARRRLSPLLRRRSVARAALREDALRQCPARLAVSACLARHGRSDVSAGDGGDARLPPRGDAAPLGRILLRPGRRLRRRRGEVLRLVARRDQQRARRRRDGRGGAALLGRERWPELRGAEHPLRPARARRRRGSARDRRGPALGARRAGAAAAVRGPRQARAPGPRRQGARLVERPGALGLRGGRPRAGASRLRRRRGGQWPVPHDIHDGRRAPDALVEGRPGEDQGLSRGLRHGRRRARVALRGHLRPALAG